MAIGESSGETPRARRQSASYSGRLLAEAVRAYEADGDAWAGETREADAAGRATGGDMETRIVARAKAVASGTALPRSLERLHKAGTWAVVVGLVLMALVGAGAARAGMEIGADGTVNVFWTLGGLLGVQSAMLAVWAVVTVLRPRAAGQGSLGAIVIGAGRWAAARLQRSREQLAAMEAMGGAMVRSGAAVWVFSAISHGLWAAFNVGCLGMVLALLSGRYYTFGWETTILSAEAYVRATAWLAMLPDAVGFASPTVEQVVATQAPAEVEALAESRWAWAGLLVGSLVCYGLGPRLVLAGVCALMAWRAQRRWRLDLSQPGYSRLTARLMPTTRSLGVVDAADEAEAAGLEAFDGRAAEGAKRGVGPPAIMGLEIRSHQGVWPPRVDGVQWLDLGFVDEREGRRRVREQLAQSEVEPARVVIVCELAATPDRGTERYLGELRRAVATSPVLVLTGGQALRERGDKTAIERRLAQWRTLAEQVGIDRESVLDLDLDHATDASLRRLAALVPVRGETSEGDSLPAVNSQRHLEVAFGRIVEHCKQWTGPPDAGAQAKLHREIASLYRRAGEGGWPTMLNVPTDFQGDWQGKVRESAKRVVALLPPGLRLRPRWLAAGAGAGALGCVAAAMLISPIAIAALPTWSAIGAAVAGAIQPQMREKASAEALTARDYTEAVDAAALFAMLLELQGYGEATISRVLERVLADVEDDRRLTQVDEVRAWLDECRHRFDMALAAEVQA